ncbi:SEC-C metal-binding domain-containing protein [Burkholderia sp. 3C]
MKDESRSEAEVFGDLAELALSPGYAHVIAQICYRDNLIAYQKEMKAEDMQKLFGPQRLIRTEITTLLGLMARGSVDLAQPSPDVVEALIQRTDRLMGELHDAMNRPARDSMLNAMQRGQKDPAIWRGEVFREPIFYGGESAYSFQYRDLATDKYEADDPWLVQNKGFSIHQARTIASAMCNLVDEKTTTALATSRSSEWMLNSWLPAFELSPEEIAHRSRVPMPAVQAFLATFTLRGHNETFKSLGDFNAVAATPLLQTGHGSVLLFQHYGIYEAIYESPFYWMMADEDYMETASAHRGEFIERFAERRLAEVFGSQHVYRNVDLQRAKGATVGEIDVLVEFGDRLIVVQAKAKKLTLEARRGNDGQLRKDFAAAIQDSYNQGWLCANAIIGGDCQLLDSHDRKITLRHTPKEIYIFNLISEHYPALAFQAREFLVYQSSDRIRPPFVMDVFLLDALTEILSSPLRLLSYVQMRLAATEKVIISHELTALGFHLKQNLWLDSKYNFVMLEDSISVDLDVAMTVRRENIPGDHTPPGILTRLNGTIYERLVAQLEQRAEPATLSLGFELLAMSEDSCRNIHHGLEAITRQTRTDGKLHDFTIGHADSGICFHCNPAPTSAAMNTLRAHCEKRKYRQKARRWFGVSVDPNANLQFGTSLDFEWEKSNIMDDATRAMKDGVPAASLAQIAREARQVKMGRNDPCPCGSGKKYKRCCMK